MLIDDVESASSKFQAAIKAVDLEWELKKSAIERSGIDGTPADLARVRADLDVLSGEIRHLAQFSLELGKVVAKIAAMVDVRDD